MEHCLSQGLFHTIKLVIVAQLICVSWKTNGQQTHKADVCLGGELLLQCPEDGALMTLSAEYGRMQYTDCLLENEHIGCTNDVLFLLDGWCSGQTTCTKSLPDPELHEANSNCWKVLVAYLDVRYTCLKVIQPSSPTCRDSTPTLITDTEGVLSSHVTHTTGCGSSQSPWRLQAMTGQTIELTLFDFGSELYKRTTNVTDTAPPRAVYGYIRDGPEGVDIPIYSSEDRERLLYTSSSDLLYIQMVPKTQTATNFMIQFKTLGCPELKPPAHAWYKRDGSQAVIGCEWSQTTWHLSCDGHRWSGVVGNCSAPVTMSPDVHEHKLEMAEFPLAMLLTCVVSVAVVLVVILVVICVVCLKKQRIKQHVAKKMVATPGHYDLDPSIEMGSILFFPNKPCDCPEPQPLVPLVPLVDLGEQHQEQGQAQECNPLHIWEQPLPELPPKTKRKSTTDSTMGTRTGRTPGDGDEHVSDVMEGDVRSLNSEPFSTQSSHKYSPLERN